jgi:hypothetical protein
MKEILRQILTIASLAALQVFVFDNLQLRGGISTFVSFEVYYFYILLLPVGMPQIALLVYAFLLGLGVDAFAGTMGIHAAACLLTGFLRIHFAPVFLGSREQNQQDLRPSIYSVGLIPFLFYTLMLSLWFHFALCLLESFTFYKFYFTLLRIFLSTVVSVIIMILFQVLFVRK